MNEQETLSSPEDEIDLLDLFSVLLKRKWLIISITLLSMIGALVYAIGSLLLPPEKSYLPNEYTPKAHMLINDSLNCALLSTHFFLQFKVYHAA